MLGWRTPAVKYNKGICGKAVETLIAKNENRKPNLLLISDSNARNLVKPQVSDLQKSVRF